MIRCRQCDSRDPHIHLNDDPYAPKTSPLQIVEGHINFKVNQIKNVSFAPPAVHYGGYWWLVDLEFIERVWPRVKARLMQSADLRPPEDEQEDQNVDEESEG